MKKYTVFERRNGKWDTVLTSLVAKDDTAESIDSALNGSVVLEYCDEVHRLKNGSIEYGFFDELDSRFRPLYKLVPLKGSI